MSLHNVSVNWSIKIGCSQVSTTLKLVLFYSCSSTLPQHIKTKLPWKETTCPLKGHIGLAASRWVYGIKWEANVQMTAQLVSTECVYWPGNSPCCCCCWCCFCLGCNYELCWFDALIWTASISLLIGRRTVWTGYSSTEHPSMCRYMQHMICISCNQAICTYIDKCRPVNF